MKTYMQYLATYFKIMLKIFGANREKNIPLHLAKMMESAYTLITNHTLYEHYILLI